MFASCQRGWSVGDTFRAYNGRWYAIAGIDEPPDGLRSDFEEVWTVRPLPVVDEPHNGDGRPS